jgi:ribonuclease HII
MINMNKYVESPKKLYFETQAWATQKRVIGIDEAGRGCLAGPVVVGAVILPLFTNQPILKDSKVMTKAQREKAFTWITEHCAWTTALADHTTIDSINIYQATLLTMKQAYLNLMQTLPCDPALLKYVVVDAMPLKIAPEEKPTGLECHHFNYGESLSPSIAAASIVAKVTRDRLMEELSGQFPAYNFAQHKGYGTAEHIAALKEHGPCAIHRTTFIKNFVEHHDQPKQTSLFC